MELLLLVKKLAKMPLGTGRKRAGFKIPNQCIFRAVIFSPIFHRKWKIHQNQERATFIIPGSERLDGNTESLNEGTPSGQGSGRNKGR